MGNPKRKPKKEYVEDLLIAVEALLNRSFKGDIIACKELSDLVETYDALKENVPTSSVRN